MKPARSKTSSSKNHSKPLADSAHRKSIQLSLPFDSSVEQPAIHESRVAQRFVPSTKKEKQYTSVKRISLVYVGSLEGRPCLTSTQEAMGFFKTYWAAYPANDQEWFVVACLDTKHRVQCVVVITIGTLDASLVHPREVFKAPIIEGSSAIVLSHNHPSGNPEPSREDRQVTERLTEAGKLLGISVLDHIIHGDGTGEVISIRERD